MHACDSEPGSALCAFIVHVHVHLPLQPGAAIPRSPHTPHMPRQMVSDVIEENFTEGWETYIEDL